MTKGIHPPRRPSVAAIGRAELPIIPVLHLDLIITMLLLLREVKEVGMLLLRELKEVGMLLRELKEVRMNHHHELEDEAVHVRKLFFMQYI